jgi:hypothetical protein
LETLYKAQDASGVTAAATAADDSMKQAAQLIAEQSKEKHPTKLPPPPVPAASTSKAALQAPPPSASTSTNLVAATSAPVGTPNVSTGPTSAREYIDLLEKYMRGEDLSTAEMENALHAQHLSHQANIIAEHPTYRPWYSEIHLANVMPSKRKSRVGKSFVLHHVHSYSFTATTLI